MLINNNITAQHSLSLFGYPSFRGNEKFMFNSLEGNPANLNGTKDWEFSALFGAEKTGKVNGNIYIASIAKRAADNFFYIRYSPGLQKQFEYVSGSVIPYGGDLEIKSDLVKSFTYSEIFGAGYAVNISDNFSAGISMRYFIQKSNEDVPNFISDTTLNTITIEKVESKTKSWRGDIGASYNFGKSIRISLNSINLISANAGNFSEEYLLKEDKGAALSANFDFGFLSLGGTYESSTSFIINTNINFNVFSAPIVISSAVFHDKYQSPFIAGIIPGINLSYGAFSISLLGAFYFSDRTKEFTVREFSENGIANIFNNQYSRNKIMASVNLALQFKEKQNLKILDAEILNDIYPTQRDDYLSNPIAEVKVASLSDKPVNAKLFSFIEQINNEPILSPAVKVMPGDTVSIPVFTMLDKDDLIINKRNIAQAEFFIITTGSEPDDKIYRPILINDSNSWDGKISSLRYFVNADYNFSNQFAKRILKETGDNGGNSILSNFAKIRKIYNRVVKGMTYVSDPRATVEYVQFPKQTIELKGGDCDDLSVTFSSLFESIGIPTAFVDYKSPDGISHVNILVNTEIPAGDWNLITENSKKIFIRKNSSGKEEVWLPIETTSLKDFDQSWKLGAEKFYSDAIENYGLSTGKVEIIDIY